MEFVRERFNELGDFVFQTDPEAAIKDVLKVLVSVMRNEKRWRTIVKETRGESKEIIRIMERAVQVAGCQIRVTKLAGFVGPHRPRNQ